MLDRNLRPGVEFGRQVDRAEPAAADERAHLITTGQQLAAATRPVRIHGRLRGGTCSRLFHRTWKRCCAGLVAQLPRQAEVNRRVTYRAYDSVLRPPSHRPWTGGETRPSPRGNWDTAR